MIQQFLTEVDWTGETDGLDYLIVDTPPGTSDEHISTVQYLQQAKDKVSGAIIVTTPEEVSLADVRKEINFCHKTKIPILGLVENMGELQLPLSKLQFESSEGGDVTSQLMDVLQQHCPDLLADAHVKINLFPPSNGGPRAMAEHFKIPYWGILPMDPQLLEACEHGKTFVEECPDSKAAKALTGFCQTITKDLKVEEVVME